MEGTLDPPDSAADLPPAIRVRFEVPRSEVERAQKAAVGTGAPQGEFDREHLRGRVHIDVGVPFEPDPVLKFLMEKRGMRTSVPYTVTLDQPVAYLVGQLAAATTVEVVGERSSMIPLSGGVGALGVECDRGGPAPDGEDDLAFSMPLERYAGVAVVPLRDGAGAVAAAVRSLEALLHASLPAVSRGPFGRFISRERAILEAVASGGLLTAGEPIVVDAPQLASLHALAGDLEEQGAHVIPFWSVSALDGNGSMLLFRCVQSRWRGGPRQAPARPLPPGALAPALALAVLPTGVRPLVARMDASPELLSSLQARLARPYAFVARFSSDRSTLAAIEEPAKEPSAGRGGTH